MFIIMLDYGRLGGGWRPYTRPGVPARVFPTELGAKSWAEKYAPSNTKLKIVRVTEMDDVRNIQVRRRRKF